LPYLDVFTVDQLAQSISAAGFVIERRWQPGRGKAVFMVAIKPA
jgi:hypothetical protein